MRDHRVVFNCSLDEASGFMNFKNIFKILGKYFFFFSFILLIPFFLSIYFKYFIGFQEHPQPHSVKAFFLSYICCLLFSAVLYFFGRESQGHLHRRESILTVALIWILTPGISSLPFIFSDTLSNPIQAYFESVSGFTTTGASVLVGKEYNNHGQEKKIQLIIEGETPVVYEFFGTVPPVRNKEGQIIAEGIEAVSKAVLFWRSLTQWLGGVGIIVLFIAVLPSLGIGGKQLMSSEIPGPTEISLATRLRETASILWKVYLFFTVLQTVLLRLTNPDVTWFDAITISFSTLSTGGFSVKNASIGAFKNPITEWVVILFMIVGSLNFAIWFNIIRKKIYKIFDVEIIIYFLVILLSCLFSTFSILNTDQQLLTGEFVNINSVKDAARFATFQIVSANSSTGFSTVNFDLWPYRVQVLMLVLMYVGGMSGSTCGGIKILRNYILFKITQFKVESIFRPETIKIMRIKHRKISQEVSIKSLVFFVLIISISVMATLLFILDGLDPESALTFVGCSINNTGFSFRAYGPMQSCAFLSNFGMILSCFLMIAGRLEFFALITILIPSFWKKTV